MVLNHFIFLIYCLIFKICPVFKVKRGLIINFNFFQVQEAAEGGERRHGPHAAPLSGVSPFDGRVPARHRRSAAVLAGPGGRGFHVAGGGGVRCGSKERPLSRSVRGG